MQPTHRPRTPHFSSGPCAKRPGWSLEDLEGALLGRSHRSKPGKDKLNQSKLGEKPHTSSTSDTDTSLTASSDSLAGSNSTTSTTGTSSTY